MNRERERFFEEMMIAFLIGFMVSFIVEVLRDER